MRQSVAAVIEGQFTAAFDYILQRNPGRDQQQRIVHRYNRGVLMEAVAVAALEQQLLHRDRPCLECLQQKANDARMETDRTRRGQVDVKVVDAFKTVWHRAIMSG